MKAVIALGANLGDPISQLDEAVSKINKELFVISVSNFIETTPVDAPGQPNYFNGVLIVETEMKPLDLLHLLQRIEDEGGRERSTENAARTLDIDLISYGEIFLDTPELTLPHPRAYQRAFVLKPWLSIDSNGVLPGYGEIKKLLAGLD
ncbi:MAG: 2-amino-4-hydroxy-6-hydroxymethyldihydropteridine diphosphokinase [Actinobacteria bacterium]|uniref:2-amino-4-hydroxy-6-hydroxymethyldihydropteridine diphosphokinase n=1 Tax=freshwater metagenome TaxID=449393 RepID=A0A6J6SX94_9ZZZZ|nr:2-amino-4-hydroxy-6-hydroxymethyldihydropteridine diphosphokinase [Actinomycetota bacterium]MSX44543.1 2-amino-4-hydroxy-6-hydroxymethyldihydropteridine diphosphokinase [Actinomycetota bacterium]MSY24112.1 2-amino-4-hydroxy-6-hydroxymethyldihydropteridine diphosphokinase [Actinomycetota bacterium]MSY99966.1 2-amino-4-hydroxy-6-hydroxymethyldihydropteridine diphosphokinase [Actinomycetota bacterium]MSZ61456.1 2-amino-4-hydroxy-6-hydroxymethyldihydropteridine diphosphokinase [Actinomycetota ba